MEFYNTLTIFHYIFYFANLSKEWEQPLLLFYPYSFPSSQHFQYIFSLTFITRETMKTIPVATAQIGGSSVFEIPYGPISAATVLGTFPLILLVFFFQKRIVAGLTAGAVKG